MKSSYYYNNNIVLAAKLPSNDIKPEPIQTKRLRPIEPDLRRTPLGETNIPLPSQAN